MSVWPWKLIKNRCCDNHIKVMEALCECAPYIVYKCLCVCVKCVRQWLLIVDHNSLGAVQASPSQQFTGVCIDLWVANLCQHQHALNNRTEGADRWVSGRIEKEE